MAQTRVQAGFWKKNQKTLAPWLFLAPGIIMFLLYVIFPIFQSIWISFYEWDGLGPKTWVGLQNYRDLADDDSFYTSLKNNLIWLLLYLLAIPLGLAVALFLNQTVPGIRLYKSLFFFPFVISQVVVGLIFTWFYAPEFGLLPKIREHLTEMDHRFDNPKAPDAPELKEMFSSLEVFSDLLTQHYFSHSVRRVY